MFRIWSFLNEKLYVFGCRFPFLLGYACLSIFSTFYFSYCAPYNKATAWDIFVYLILNKTWHIEVLAFLFKKSILVHKTIIMISDSIFVTLMFYQSRLFIKIIYYDSSMHQSRGNCWYWRHLNPYAICVYFQNLDAIRVVMQSLTMNAKEREDLKHVQQGKMWV